MIKTNITHALELLHGSGKIRILVSSGKSNILLAALLHNILFLKRGNKIHIFKPQYNFLFII